MIRGLVRVPGEPQQLRLFPVGSASVAGISHGHAFSCPAQSFRTCFGTQQSPRGTATHRLTHVGRADGFRADSRQPFLYKIREELPVRTCPSFISPNASWRATREPHRHCCHAQWSIRAFRHQRAVHVSGSYLLFPSKERRVTQRLRPFISSTYPA